MTNCIRWHCCSDQDLVVGTRPGQMTDKKLPEWSCCRGTDQDEWKLAKEWKMKNVRRPELILLQGHWPGQMAGRQLCSVLWWWRLVVRDTYEPQIFCRVFSFFHTECVHCNLCVYSKTCTLPSQVQQLWQRPSHGPSQKTQREKEEISCSEEHRLLFWRWALEK